MNLKNFLKNLIIFDVFWGRRSKIYHGIKDGGAKATSIGDSTKALVHNGNTIFNVNDPDYEAFGGHFHSFAGIDEQESLFTKGLICNTTDNIGDWVTITGVNTVTKVSDNTLSQVVGVIVEKPTTTSCKIVIRGKAAVFSSLDVTKPRYFLSTTGGLTDIPPTTGNVLELGKALTDTTLIVTLTIALKRA